MQITSNTSIPVAAIDDLFNLTFDRVFLPLLLMGGGGVVSILSSIYTCEKKKIEKVIVLEIFFAWYSQFSLQVSSQTWCPLDHPLNTPENV